MPDIPPPTLPAAEREAELRFLRRVLIAAGVVVLALALWQIRGALLLVFGGLVVATLLSAVSRPLERWLGLARRWSLPAAVLLVVLLLSGVATLVGNEVAAQARELLGQLPAAAAAVEERFGVDLGALSTDKAETGASAKPDGAIGLDLARQLAAGAAGVGSAALGLFAALALVVVGGVFLAADPALYRRGLVFLLPAGLRGRAEGALEDAGRALDLWLRAQLISMAVVGLLVGLGAWAIGLPSPLALGLFAGLADFVPFVGPLIGAVPGVMLALGQGWTATLWTVALYVVVQQVEANMVFPLLGQRMVDAPPALLLFAVVAAGALFGTAGVMLAAPLTIVGLVLVQRLYVRETLGEPVKVAGEEG